jgi:hypothetical protein
VDAALPVRAGRGLSRVAVADSKRSLVLQGGIFDDARSAAFSDRIPPMLGLRRWDDAKSADAEVPPLAHFVRHMKSARSSMECAPGSTSRVIDLPSCRGDHSFTPRRCGC